jgi:hypothetical protein
MKDEIDTINRIGFHSPFPQGFESLVLQLDEEPAEIDLHLLAR